MGLNYEYPDADWAKREQISEKLRQLTLGLIYFMQNDAEVPEDQRKLARTYNLPKDEFLDTNHFPFQLYVREGRRIQGEYTLSENDLTYAPGAKRPPIHRDSISAGEYPFDSMPVQRIPDETGTILEGYLLMMHNITRPYQIPYRIMVPQRVEGLLVPVPASATHIAFSSLRLEPTWMAMGQAAGVAAHLSIGSGERLRDLRPEKIQRLLLANQQVLTYFKDMDKSDPAHDAMQFLGTKGFFPDYLARSKRHGDGGGCGAVADDGRRFGGPGAGGEGGDGDDSRGVLPRDLQGAGTGGVLSNAASGAVGGGGGVAGGGALAGDGAIDAGRSGGGERGAADGGAGVPVPEWQAVPAESGGSAAAAQGGPVLSGAIVAAGGGATDARGDLQ